MRYLHAFKKRSFAFPALLAFVMFLLQHGSFKHRRKSKTLVRKGTFIDYLETVPYIGLFLRNPADASFDSEDVIQLQKLWDS